MLKEKIVHNCAWYILQAFKCRAKSLRDLNVNSVSLLSVWTHVFRVVVSSWIKKSIQGGIIYQRLNTKKKRSKNSKIYFLFIYWAVFYIIL